MGQAKLTKPLLKFKVYVRVKYGPKTPFFWCSVWRTLPQMRAHMADITREIRPGWTVANQRKALAGCYSWKHTIDDVLQPEMGIIVLAMAYSGSAAISHECAHAAFRFLERISKRHTDNYREELFCCVVGEMTGQIVRKLLVYDRKNGK